MFTKDPQDINAIATIDTAIGNFKKALVRDTRRLGTDDWASRIDKVTKGQNQSPNDEYLKGVAPADVSSNPELIRYLKKKNDGFSVFNTGKNTGTEGQARGCREIPRDGIHRWKVYPRVQAQIRSRA